MSQENVERVRRIYASGQSCHVLLRASEAVQASCQFRP